MATTFRPYQPDQMFLLAPSPKDWLPEDHLAYFISEMVERLDLRVFYARYEGDGRRNCPFDPRMMVKILLYGYATGIRSSRKLAKKLHEDVAFRVLAAGNFPAHRTIAEFRQVHLKEFQELFVRVVDIAREAGLGKLGTVAVDGSKIKANASKRKAMTYGRMKKERARLRAEIAEMLAEAERTDAQEDGLYGPDQRGDELPEELRRRSERVAKIEAAMVRLEEAQAAEDRQKGRTPEDGRKSRRGRKRFKRDFGVPEDSRQINFTDPDSRIMQTSSEGFQQCYNTQMVVTENDQLIVGYGVTDSAADNRQLIPLLEEVEAITGSAPERVLADSGYRGEENCRQLEERGLEGYVALGREGKTPQHEPHQSFPATVRMHEKLQREEGQAHYRRRKGIVEPVNGWIKEILGFRRFSLRGLEEVGGEWALVCTAVNLKHLHRLLCWV